MKLIRITRSDLVVNGEERTWLLNNIHWGMVFASVEAQDRHEVASFQAELVRHGSLPGDVIIGVSDRVRALLAAALQNPLGVETDQKREERAVWFALFDPATEEAWRQEAARVNRTYHWVGLDPKGEEVAGELSADTQEEAIEILRKRGIYPTTVQVVPVPYPERSYG